MIAKIPKKGIASRVPIIIIRPFSPCATTPYGIR